MTNLKVLVVDDEDLIRNGVGRKVERLISNAVVVGKAQDATEALEMVKKYHPHIVITDIRMPEIDGLQFINMARNISNDIRFIVLSGYQDFEYARRAMRLGVEDYLLKPIDNQQLKDIIIKLECKIKEGQSQKNFIIESKAKIDIGVNFLRNKHLTDLISSDINSDKKQIIKNLELLDINFIYSYFSVITIAITKLDSSEHLSKAEDPLLANYAISNIAEEILSSVGTAVSFENLKGSNQIIIAVNHESLLNNNPNFNLSRLCNNIINSVNKFLKLSISIGIGETYDSINNVSMSYLESYTSVMQRIVLGENRVIHISDIPDFNRITFFLPDENKLLLLSYLREGTNKKAHEIVDNIIAQIRKKGLSYLNIKVLYVDLILLFTKAVKDSGGTMEKIFTEDIMSETFISKYPSLSLLHSWLNSCINSICDYIINLRKSGGRRVVEEIIEFIDNYYYTNLNLNELAGKYFINPNYLSQLFKSETGENFVDYVTKIRIKKAKELLKTTKLKSYKISELVGYSSSRYFSDVFQKNVGLTPTEYRQQVG